MGDLKRPKEPMPDFVSDALEEHDLKVAYDRRPPYQRNDYLRWIKRAKQDATKQRRLLKMLKELRQGYGYMGMKWKS